MAAARRAREDEKLRGLLSRASSGKGAKERKGKTIKVPTRANPQRPDEEKEEVLGRTTRRSHGRKSDSKRMGCG